MDMLASPTSFKIVVTDRETGEPHYLSPRSEEEFFLQVRASAAVPVFHPKVSIERRVYVDGGLSDPIPLEKALADGYEEVIVVCNRPLAEIGKLAKSFLGIYSAYAVLPNVRLVEKRIATAVQIVRMHADRIRVISPTRALPNRWQFDSGHHNLNRLVDLGIQDAIAFITRHG
jgi:predicted patatin/cPLA2 family phospholipase